MKKIQSNYFFIKRMSIFLLASMLNLSLYSQVVIQRCDVTTGWQGAQALSVDNTDKKEGSGSLSTSAEVGTFPWFSKSFSSTQTGISGSGYLSFWLYISDASVLEGGAIEISSSGGPDDMESSWLFDKNNVSSGWNEMQLQINASDPTGGGANLDSINFFRIYQNTSAPVTAKIDFIRFTPSLDVPVWPVLDVARVDNSTLDGKVMFGYQGWFNHPDDGAGLGWVHWGDLYEPIRLSCDNFPDMREFGADEKYNSHFTYPDGSMAPVFSSYKQNTVVRHMKWIRDYNLDGVFIQRFISSSDRQKTMDHKDTVAMNVMRGCEKYGGVFAMMYDGVANKVDDMKADWIHMVDDLGLTESDRYLHHRGLPLVSLWGYTVRDDATIDQLIEMIDFFTNNPNPKYRASVKLGVTGNFPDVSVDWLNAFKNVDVISPWFSGHNEHHRAQPWCDENNVDYLPVVHPGFSWHNLSLDYEDHGSSGDLNRTPREGGNYLLDEVTDAVTNDAKAVYIAMFDEIDEGTAMFKLAETINDVPRERDWVTLDIDGYNLPSDWYLRLASLTSDVIKGYADNKKTLANLGTPPEGIMTIRITDEINGGGNGEMEFIFPDFPNETTLEISIDSGVTWAYSTPDDAGTYNVTGLAQGSYPVFIRHGSASPMVDMGLVKITDVFEGLPSQATNPFPGNGASDVRLTSTLGWTPGDHAVSHHIFFGTSENPDSITYQSSTSFNPGELSPDTTYYWRIDEANGSGKVQGPLWSFKTAGLGGPKNYVVLDYCDEVTSWSSHNSVSIDSDQKQEGFSSLHSNGAGTVWYSKAFDPPVNSFSDTSGYLDLWVYVSDVSAFDGGGQLEIGSAGKPDEDELSWDVSSLGLQNGWNELHLPLSEASQIGSPDLGAINWFRLYQFVNTPIETRIDFIRFTELATMPLSSPLNLTATGGIGTIELNWNDNSEPTLAGYNIYRRSFIGSYEKINNDPILSSAYVDTNVLNGFSYYYSVSAVDSLGNESDLSGEVLAAPVITTIQQAETNLEVNIYPNPAGNLVTLEVTLKESSDIKISLYDLSGRIVKRLNKQEMTPGNYHFKLPLTDIKQGTYLITLNMSGLRTSQVLLVD